MPLRDPVARHVASHIATAMATTAPRGRAGIPAQRPPAARLAGWPVDPGPRPIGGHTARVFGRRFLNPQLPETRIWAVSDAPIKTVISSSIHPKLGGLNAKGIQNREEAKERAEQLRPIFTELTGRSARAIATALNERKIATPTGGKWHAATVIRVQKRIAEGRPD